MTASNCYNVSWRQKSNSLKPGLKTQMFTVKWTLTNTRAATSLLLADGYNRGHLIEAHSIEGHLVEAHSIEGHLIEAYSIEEYLI